MSRGRNLLLGGVLTALLATVAAVAAGPAGAAPGLRLQYKTSAPGATADQAEPWFDLINEGTSPVSLADVRIRYFFRADSPAQQYRFACSWAVVSCSRITGTFGAVSPATPTADRYLEVGFTSGHLAAGARTGDMQLRFHRSDWQRLTQSDDFSFGPARTTYGDWTKVAVYRGGERVWGEAPGGADPTPTPTPTVTPTGPPGGSGVVFDDFAYSGPDDPALSAHHWTVRTNAGGPGVPGASWPRENVSFPVLSGGNRALQLRAGTDGTAAGTTQSEVLHQRKFLEGTYAARVRFSDAPVAGPDGDHVVQTFFTITPLRYDLDPDYSEQDFEYLPNGGWGEPGNILYATSWETYRNEPWQAVNVHTEVRQSYEGWHDLVLQVADGRIRYYVDGALFAEHGGDYYPETVQSVNFNLWFISGGLLGSSTPRHYVQQVDWFYHSKNEVVAPADVLARVGRYRADSVPWVDTVPAS
ncbi:cellulose binding domain-containing protein [Bailinhaonella thermotolerans]|uniref:Hydrolase n=1 Tax=Bailinhaonella thermotolerans TaxID=1070861 RepID=A0A3A4B093_9ACTN|nr:cellulose binding domain-containing protein [Bailinhaonella thermotolerans]RJL30880.1 hydrolase [Bailinhaonella thermotolerans]